MANIFYISPIDNPFVAYELHATTAIDVSFKSSISSQPSENSLSQSDNVVLDPVTVKFTGVLTEVKRGGGIISQVQNLVSGATEDISIGEYITSLRSAQEDKLLFNVYFSGDAETENILDPIRSVIITDLSIHKDATLGKSWKVTLTLQEESTIGRTGEGSRIDQTTSGDSTADTTTAQENTIVGKYRTLNINTRVVTPTPQ